MRWPWSRRAVSPGEIPTLLNLAKTACQEGKRKRAITLFKRVLQADSHHVPALVNLGAIFSQNPKTIEEARVLMKKALNLDPENKAILLNLGTIYAQTDDLEGAERCLKKLSEADPAYPDLHYNMAHVLLRKGLFRDAFVESQVAIRHAPNNINAQILHEKIRQMIESNGKNEN